MKTYRYWLAGAILAGAMIFSGCAAEPTETALDLATETTDYTVTFQVGDETTKYTVPAGEALTLPEDLCPAGMVLVGWLDDGGAETTPEGGVVTADACYTALLLPDLSGTGPYLFTDEQGFAHPEKPITGEDCRAAILALAVEPKFLPDLTLPEGSLDREALTAALSELFLPEDLAAAMEPVPEGTVSRQIFAEVLNSLLGRNEEMPVTLSDGQTPPRDVDLSSGGGTMLLAVMDYLPEQAGKPIVEALLDGTWEPGFTLLAGRLYYADETGALLRDGSLGELTFGPDGAYTSGDAELDAAVTERLAQFVAEDPEADRFDLLRRAFEYCRDEYRYVNRGVLYYGATGWEVDRAKEMFSTGAGNCYNYAAAFWSLARGLGYEAECIAGGILDYGTNHAWCSIRLDGQTYFFDPQMAMREKTGSFYNFGYDMFMIPMWALDNWLYVW